MTTDNFCFYLQNRLIQTGANGTVILPPLVFPDCNIKELILTSSFKEVNRTEPSTSSKVPRKETLFFNTVYLEKNEQEMEDSSITSINLL